MLNQPNPAQAPASPNGPVAPPQEPLTAKQAAVVKAATKKAAIEKKFDIFEAILGILGTGVYFFGQAAMVSLFCFLGYAVQNSVLGQFIIPELAKVFPAMLGNAIGLVSPALGSFIASPLLLGFSPIGLTIAGVFLYNVAKAAALGQLFQPVAPGQVNGMVNFLFSWVAPAILFTAALSCGALLSTALWIGASTSLAFSIVPTLYTAIKTQLSPAAQASPPQQPSPAEQPPEQPPTQQPKPGPQQQLASPAILSAYDRARAAVTQAATQQAVASAPGIAKPKP